MRTGMQRTFGGESEIGFVKVSLCHGGCESEDFVDRSLSSWNEWCGYGRFSASAAPVAVVCHGQYTSSSGLDDGSGGDDAIVCPVAVFQGVIGDGHGVWVEKCVNVQTSPRQ